jgi:hypothetical protein
VKIVGFDAGPNQIEALRDGTVQALVAQEPGIIGKFGVDEAVTALDGGQNTKKVQTGFTVITQENLNGEGGAARTSRAADLSAVDLQTLSVEADAAQIRDGGRDVFCRGCGADADDGFDTGRAAAMPAGASSNTATTFGRHAKALRGEPVGVRERFPAFDVFACDQDVRGDEAGRCHACGGDGTAAGRDDPPTFPEAARRAVGVRPVSPPRLRAWSSSC